MTEYYKKLLIIKNINIKFNSIGKHEIKFVIIDDSFIMNYMFQNIQEILSVNMTTNYLNNKINKKPKIISMIKAFENCQNFYSFSLEEEKFNLSKIKSMQGLFNNSSLSELIINNNNNKNIKINNNLKDISYMFSSTKLKIFNSSIFNLQNSHNIKYIS